MVAFSPLTRVQPSQNTINNYEVLGSPYFVWPVVDWLVAAAYQKSSGRLGLHTSNLIQIQVSRLY